MKKQILSALALTMSIGCSGEKYEFGAPEVAPIVDGAVPSGLKGGTSLHSMQDFLQLMDTASTEESFKSYVTNYVFKKDTTGKVAGPVYYRYWIDVLDEGMAQVETRISERDDEDSACWNQDAVELTHTFTIGSEDVKFAGKYNCWESQSTPNSATGGFQKMAFGKDDDNFYLMYVTSDAKEFTSGGQGERIVMARAAADSSSADIWFIGRSFQSGPNGSMISGTANHILANKTTGAFSFGLTDEAIGSTNCAMFARSNGSVVNFQARTPVAGSATECQDVTGMAWGTGACYDSATLATATGCEDLKSAPSDFGTSAPFKESDVTAIEEDSKTLANLDFDAAGVAEFK
jgi:hypothetical protein